MKAERFIFVMATCVLGAGCGAEGLDASEPDSDAERQGEMPLALPMAANSGPRPTLEEFAASLRQTIRSGDEELEAYVIEGDMLVPYEVVEAYYEARYPDVQPKGVGIVVGAAGPFIGPTPFLTRAMPVRYCYEERFSADEREEIDLVLARTMSVWASVANVSFERISSLDGSACTPEAAGKDIQIFRFQQRIGQASFPLEQSQIIGTPYPPLPASVYLHEVGHVMGLAHEQFHTDSGCPQKLPVNLASRFPPTRNQNITTRLDTKSVMLSTDSAGNVACDGPSQNFFLSDGDIESARRLYGP